MRKRDIKIPSIVYYRIGSEHRLDLENFSKRWYNFNFENIHGFVLLKCSKFHLRKRMKLIVRIFSAIDRFDKITNDVSYRDGFSTFTTFTNFVASDEFGSQNQHSWTKRSLQNDRYIEVGTSDRVSSSSVNRNYIYSKFISYTLDPRSCGN